LNKKKQWKLFFKKYIYSQSTSNWEGVSNLTKEELAFLFSSVCVAIAELNHEGKIDKTAV